MARSDRNPVTLWRYSRVRVAAVFCAGIAAWAVGTPADAQFEGKVPELASSSFAWLAFGADWRNPPAGMRGPIGPDPDHPYHGNLDGPGQVTPRLSNYKDPVLKPWAAKQMRLSNEEVLRGERSIPFSAQHRCYPGGVPGQLLFPAEPFYFIQTPKEVRMIWQRDHMVRRVYLTDKHSERVKPSWFGESIGHYENGDTLVIDTIGITTRTFVDSYQTPHTDQLHVVERIQIVDDGKALEATAYVEDPGAFTTPWSARQRYRRAEQGPLREDVCAENNANFFNYDILPIPHADKPDF
jgi:hypothetical protein